MLFVSFLSWWYGLGWQQFGRRALRRVAQIIDFFSIKLLARTLFSTYRQISVDRVRGSASVRLHAWTDRQISRFIGAFIRLIVITGGLLCAAAVAIFSLISILLWPLGPIMPIIIFIVAVING